MAIEKVLKKSIENLTTSSKKGLSLKDEYDNGKDLAKGIRDDTKDILDKPAKDVEDDATHRLKDARDEKHRKDNKDKANQRNMSLTSMSSEDNNSDVINNFLFDIIISL